MAAAQATSRRAAKRKGMNGDESGDADATFAATRPGQLHDEPMDSSAAPAESGTDKTIRLHFPEPSPTNTDEPASAHRSRGDRPAEPQPRHKSGSRTSKRQAGDGPSEATNKEHTGQKSKKDAGAKGKKDASDKSKKHKDKGKKGKRQRGDSSDDEDEVKSIDEHPAAAGAKTAEGDGGAPPAGRKGGGKHRRNLSPLDMMNPTGVMEPSGKGKLERADLDFSKTRKDTLMGDLPGADELHSLDTTSLGQSMSKEQFAEMEPKIRADLLSAQKKLAVSPFSCVMIINGSEGSDRAELVNTLLAWLDPHGVQVHGMGEPSQEERERPWMWRYWQRLPPRTRSAIFYGGWYIDTAHRCGR